MRAALFAALLVYGFWGYGTKVQEIFKLIDRPLSGLHSILFHGILFICFFQFLKLSRTDSLRAARNGIQTSKYLFVLIPLSLVFSMKKILFTTDFTGDEIAYMQNSYTQSKVIANLMLKKVSVLNNVTPFTVILSISLFLSILLISLLFWFMKKERQPKIQFVFLILILTKVANEHLFKYDGIYPNLYGSFLQLFNTLAYSPLLVRLTQWTFIAVALVSIYQKFWSSEKRRVFLFALFALPIFGLSYFWTSIEPAVFFVIPTFWVLTLCIKQPSNYILNSSYVITMATFMRPTSLILIPILLCSILMSKKYSEIRIGNFFPLLLIFPYVIESGYQNLASELRGTRYIEDSPYDVSDFASLNLLQSIISQFSSFGAVVVIGMLGLLISKKMTRLTVINYVAFNAFVFSIMIPSSTQGLNKYALEIIYTPILVAIAHLIESLKFKWRNLQILIAMIVMLFLNHSQTRALTNLDEKLNNWKQVRLLTNYPVENEQAYKYALSLPIGNRCLNPGTTYGVFPFVAAGASLKEIEILEKTFNDNESTFLWGKSEVNISKLRARCLIIDNYPLKEELFTQLRSSGWVQIYDVITPKVETSVTIWQRTD